MITHGGSFSLPFLREDFDNAENMDRGASILDTADLGPYTDSIDESTRSDDLPVMAFDDERVPHERVAGRRVLFPYHFTQNEQLAVRGLKAEKALLLRIRGQLAGADQSIPSPFTMSVTEAVVHYGVSDRTLSTRCSHGDGSTPAFRIRRRWIYLRPKPYPESPYHDKLIKLVRSQPLVGLQVAADLYGVSLETIYVTCRLGESFVPFVKIGNRFFVRSRAILAQLRIDA